MNNGKVEGSSPLSPLQKGMLFEALSAPRGGVNIEQMVCTLREEISPDALRQAWQQVAARHAILRTSFRWDAEPVQVVWEEVALPWVAEDWRARPPEERQSRLAAWLREDRARGFVLDEAPLMRLALFTFGDTEHRLVWTFHHALLDGRSFAIVLREVFVVLEGADLPVGPRPYRDYIDWRQTLHPEASADFWRETLRGFTATTPLPTGGLSGHSAGPEQGDRELRLPTATTSALRQFAQAHDLTLNTLVQGAWALLLSRYSAESEVVFGATRACRHSTIEGAAEMVGLFINTLPVRVRCDPEAKLIPWLRELRAQWMAMRTHEHTPLVSVQAWSEVVRGHALFETLVVFENQDLNSSLHALGGAWAQRDFRLYEKTSFALTLAAYAGPELQLRLGFDHARFSDETIDRLLRHLSVILGYFVANPGQLLREVPLLTEAEHRQLVAEWNPLPKAGPPAADATLHQRFAAQAARTPDAVALTCGGAQLTYRELDARANDLAAHLSRLGVGPEVIVGLCLERSIDLIVGLLAILKAGGAYLPIDLAYPPERIAFILEDAQAPVLLTQSALVGSLAESSAHIVAIDQLPADDPQPSPITTPPPGPDSLAYVIYTSGSTGKPKGCCITHHNVVRLFASTDEWFRFGPSDVWTMFHSVAFDFSVWEIWGALLYGGRVVIVPHRLSRSPEQFHELLRSEGVTVLNQTPSAFRQLIAADETAPPLTSLRLVIFGGEALELATLQPWFARYGDTQPQLVNMYGITETTVHVTYRPLRVSDLSAGSVIGVPIPDLRIHILDPALRPVPIGVPGEMFVGGAGVARGYLRRPELTAARFIPCPFEPGARLYRTGDLARWLPDRDIEYLGRIDEQVKIRGFRIELGEIQSVLLAHPAIREAVVLARSEPGREKRLVAWLVPVAAAPPADELRAHLKTRLPDYMVPSAFVFLDRLPLTGNGKLDQRALPAPEPARPELAASFVAPRTAAERTLAEIWQRVLRLERVGVNDNFFELGGDSILSIMIIAQARKAGLPLAPKHLFDHQTIAELAVVVPAPEVASEEFSESGETPLTPIQRWFFEHDFADPQHWNQAFVFRCDEPLDFAALEKAVEAVARRVDESYRPAGASDAAPRTGAFVLSPADGETAIAAAAAQAQASLDLVHGPLLRVVHFAANSSRSARLLIVAHHLAVDGVSWHLLIEDLETAYAQALGGVSIQLSPAGTSPGLWARHLARAAHSPAIRSDLAYWRKVQEAPWPALPLDHPGGENMESSARTVTVRLSAEETDALLQQVPAARQARINDVLLAALGPAFAEWTGERRLLLDLEGHGREETLVAELTGTAPADLSRSIGWFTTIFPVGLEVPGADAAALEAVQAQLRAIPHRGLSYGLLRYLTDDATARALPSTAPVLFNYLGQFDQMLAGAKLFHLTHEPSGPWHSPRARRTHLVEINCLVAHGCLEARWIYSENLHRAATIERVADRFMAGLRTIIASAVAGAGAGGESYPLSPIQQLYHTLESAQPNAGFSHWHCLLRGPLDVERFAQAWRAAFVRHPILRSVFAADAQRVLPTAAPALHVENWRDFSAAEQEERLAEFLRADHARPFDLSQPPLTRLALLELRAEEWRFVWSHHHLQIDGWSWPLLFREVGALYEGTKLPPAPPYRDYLEWLQRRSPHASRDFWQNYLRGFAQTTPLPGRAPRGPEAPADFCEETHHLSTATTAALRELARRSRVTLNILVQTAWALLLSRAAGCGDIVFGASFSGRPSELPGVENIVGPFVNNLPVRITIQGAEPLPSLLGRVQTGLFALLEHQATPLPQIQEWSEMPWHSRLFESLLVFQNYLVDDAASRLGDGVTIHDLVAPIRTNYPLTLVAIPGPELELMLIASAQACAPAAVAQCLAQLVTLLEAMSTGTEQTAAELQALLPEVPRAHPAPQTARSGALIPPRTPTEHAIAAVWREAFGGADVGMQDNFFDLGGHSLLMLRVHARLREALKNDISLVRMFQHPTIESLARHLDGGQQRNTLSAGIAARAAAQKAALARQRLNTRQK